MIRSCGSIMTWRCFGLPSSLWWTAEHALYNFRMKSSTIAPCTEIFLS